MTWSLMVSPDPVKSARDDADNNLDSSDSADGGSVTVSITNMVRAERE